MVKIRCFECMEAGVYKPAEYLLYDDAPHQIKPLCKEHFEAYKAEYGEVGIDYTVLSDDDLEMILLCVIEEANRTFEWYEGMLKQLRAENDRLKKIMKLDWIKR